MTLRFSASAFCAAAILSLTLVAVPQSALAVPLVDPPGHGCFRLPGFSLPIIGAVNLRTCAPISLLSCTTTRAATGICSLWALDAATCTDRCSACGNGEMEAAKGEQCDDGNTVNGDGCDNSCQYEPLYCCLAGVRTPLTTDEINSMPLNSEYTGYDCSLFAGGAPRMLTDYTELNRDIACGCGDGVVDPATETCDLGRSSGVGGMNRTNRNTQGYGCYNCQSLCRNDVVDTDSYVVDWYKKSDWAYGGPYGIYTEVCDDNNDDNNDNCDNYCQTCGNNRLDGDEVCDMGRSNIDGHSYNKDYGCSDDCSEFLCGNGIIDDSYVSNIDGTDAEPDPNDPADYLVEQCDDGNETSGDGCSAYCQEETGACCIAPENLFFDGQPTAVAETRSACETLAGTWNNRQTVLTRVPGAADPITDEQARNFCSVTEGDKYCCGFMDPFTPFKLDPTLAAGVTECGAYPTDEVFGIGPTMNLATAEKACAAVYCESNNCELKPKFDCAIGYGKNWRPPNNSEHQAAMTRLSLPMNAEGFCKYWITPGA